MRTKEWIFFRHIAPKILALRQQAGRFFVQSAEKISRPLAHPDLISASLKLTMFNTDDPQARKKVGENDQSIGLLIEKNGTRVFLAADLDNKTGDERRLAKSIGKVDLLKVGHHSYSGSSCAGFIRTLSPEVCVVTNKFDALDRTTLTRIERICRPSFYITGKENGVLAVLGDNGNVACYGQIQP